MNGDRQLEERLRHLAWPVERGTGWVGIEARAGGRKQPSASRRRSRLRVVVFASIAVVLVAAVAIGGFAAAQYLGRPHFVLAITDDTNIGADAQTPAGGAGGGSWQRLPVPIEGGTVNSLIMDPSNPSILYAGTSQGLFKSTDGAANWSRLSLPMGVFTVAVDPASPQSIFAGTVSPDGGVSYYRSDNGGDTWNPFGIAVGRGLGPFMFFVGFDTSSSPSTIYGMGRRDNVQLWRSTDRGETWTPLSAAEQDEVSAKLDPASLLPAAAAQALRAFLASFGGTVTDADTGSALEVIADPIIDPNHPSSFYAGTVDGVYKSADGGKTWERASAGLTGRWVGKLVTDPTSPATLYVATSGGICKSDDGGATWSTILAGQGSVVDAPSSPSRLYAWTSGGFFRTDDGGLNWTRLEGRGLPQLERSDDPLTGSEPLSELVLVAANDPDTVFAVSGTTGRLFKSTDGGTTWTQVLDGVEAAGAEDAVVADPQNPSTLFAISWTDTGLSGTTASLFKSTDAGGTWTVVAPEQWVGFPVTDIAVDGGVPPIVYAIQWRDIAWGPCSVSRSRDGGATWEKAELRGLARGLWQLRFDPRSPDTLYAFTSSLTRALSRSTDLHRSTDGGATWENITGALRGSQVLNLVIDSGPGGTLYATTEAGLYKWVPVSK